MKLPGLAVSAAAYLGVQAYAGEYGWWPLLHISFLEKAIHPAATGALADTFLEASHSVQVLVTTHSPDLLEHDAIGADDLIAVSSERGVTRLGRVDDFARSALADHLSTPGELLRLDQLRPDVEGLG